MIKLKLRKQKIPIAMRGKRDFYIDLLYSAKNIFSL